MDSHYKGEDKPELVVKDGDSLIIKPRALDITWGGDPRYWKLSSGPGPAELLQVSWLQVNGKAKLSCFQKGKSYAVSFKVELKPDNFGWANRPVYFMAGIAGRRSWKKTDLSKLREGDKFKVPLGEKLEFRVPENHNENDNLEFGMYEIWKGRWKGGLVVYEVLIEPA